MRGGRRQEGGAPGGAEVKALRKGWPRVPGQEEDPCQGRRGWWVGGGQVPKAPAPRGPQGSRSEQ